MLKSLASLLLVVALAVCASSASAQMCDSRVSSPAISPTKPVFAAAAAWLQWLNAGSFTCAAISGNNMNVRCTQGTTWYEARSTCTASLCTVKHYDRNSTLVVRNTSTYIPGAQVWNFTFDAGWPTAYVSMACLPDLNHLSNPCITVYGTCIQ